MQIRENVPLKDLTTMRLGGPARYVITVGKKSEIPAAYAFASEKNLPVHILGGGANTIAHDEGFAGVIIINQITGIFYEKNQVTANGGEIWDNVVKFTTDRDLTGIEALSQIPGLAGAAPVQNIGAYGQDVSQVFLSALVYDTDDGEFKTLTKDDFHFSYRHSILNTTEIGRYFVVSITLELKEGQMPRPFYNSIENYIAEHRVTDFAPKSIREIVTNIRADKLPDPAEKPSAGSFFKNVYLTAEEAKKAEQNHIPVYRGHDGLKINSAWLIEQCGLKGQLIHGFRINAKAPLVLINESATSYHDLDQARSQIRQAVQEKFGYYLEQEPIEISRAGDAAGGTPICSPAKMGEAAAAGPARHTKILNGSELAGFIKERQAHQVASMTKKPKLLIVRDSDNPVIMTYVNLKKRYGADIGVTVEDACAKTAEDLQKIIETANQNPEIHGIILQLPLQDPTQTDSLTSLITPKKDVDGLSGQPGAFDSATATAIIWLLAGYDIDLKNQKIALVGRGKLVGAPLEHLWETSGYDVTVFHKGDDLTNLAKFDILVSATGVPGLILNDYVKPGAILVDAGTASEGGVLKGDLAPEIRQRTDLTAITPEKGGVGPLTVTCLFDHVIQATTK